MYQSDLLELDTDMEDLSPKDEREKRQNLKQPTTSRMRAPPSRKTSTIQPEKRHRSSHSSASGSKETHINAHDKAKKRVKAQRSASGQVKSKKSYNPGPPPSLRCTTPLSDYSNRDDPIPRPEAIMAPRLQKIEQAAAKGLPPPVLENVLIPVDPPGAKLKSTYKTPRSRDFNQQWSYRLNKLTGEDRMKTTTIDEYIETVPEKDGLYLNLLESISKTTFNHLRVDLSRQNKGRALIAFTQYGDKICDEWESLLEVVLEPFYKWAVHKSSPQSRRLKDIAECIPFNTPIYTPAQFLAAMKDELITFSLKTSYYNLAYNPRHRAEINEHFRRCKKPAPGTDSTEYIQFINRNRHLVKSCYRRRTKSRYNFPKPPYL